MMRESLQHYLGCRAGEGRARIWLDHTHYSTRLLVAPGASPWDSPAVFMAYLNQSQALLKSDVVTIDVGDLYRGCLDQDPAVRLSMVGKRRPAGALKALLDAFAPRELLAEVLVAATARFGGAMPVVLRLPSPRAFVAFARRMAEGDDLAFDADTVESAAVYMADYLRYFASLQPDGLLLAEHPADLPASAAEIELYGPVLNLAEHYRWGLGLHLGDGAEDPSAGVKGVGFAIAGAASGAMGIDVSADLRAPSETAPGRFLFATLPGDAEPEQVLTSLARLRGEQFVH